VRHDGKARRLGTREAGNGRHDSNTRQRGVARVGMTGSREGVTGV